ncbi:hypothetical protein DTO013E5_1744 [Penicillium roqueforti]|uniref:Genomic scaffold, ProqFM164S03 n=1 Tax=Penicillium roqueforti (strain FM164) TaxID=1365484 RepID=W6QII6_PENRF|nr:uncharacterized protein LCP9604111_2647 [Penicillium roqueforti]CDM34014.1 unnamed protein product [Penicillium roqueforti FM164]KAF9251246.1 hypothetical protein LCP9604111_2647 [Penicillium roqueforti]KAI1837894.1 hypothetical protein CBS147337_1117 [Penicillium roqueforti]KAI2678584.1 hypothetical protein CBS147355_4469 [Penicillium roqueforti]KAI2705763.1 hypothetical protein CBS147372_2066 [Penicillium roqueforti]
MSPDPYYETLDAPDGTALTWIFDHCLRYADSYEISLRAAYELNCHPSKSTMTPSFIPRSPSIFRDTVWSKKGHNSKSSVDAPSYDTNAEFRACLSKTVAEVPSQPCALPPSFIISFVRRCFCLDLSEVDFAQALTALDYIRTLQNRWKKEIDAAFNRLNVTSEDARDPEHSEVARNYPNLLTWYENISNKARTIDFLYTQVYIGLRRWVLVNQMMLEPFDKANCLALLNTLLPPVHRDSSTPTQQLSTATLGLYRDTFFKYITTFEADPSIVEPIIQQGAAPGDENGWPALHATIERYMNAALEMIDECVLINEPCQITKSGVQRRTDSGISFGVDFGPCPTISHSSDTEKPLPHFPEPTIGTSKHGSFLERFSSLSAWGKKKDPKKEQQKEFARSLKKMQSLGKLTSPTSSAKSSTKSIKSVKTPPKFKANISFDLTEDKRRRLIDEAQARKAVGATEAAESIGQAT